MPTNDIAPDTASAAPSFQKRRSWGAYRNIIIWEALFIGPMLYIGFLSARISFLWIQADSPAGAPMLYDLLLNFAILPIVCAFGIARLFPDALQEALVRMPGAEHATTRAKIFSGLAILGASVGVAALIACIPTKPRSYRPY